ncbi:alpha/beta hydrolase [Sphingomonas sp. MS122]|uniref:alpha/beta hydrolase n=1 Tax=Sphingomonas sp. MS122 TaxID=3412683 RepID=UPI003C307D93
MPFDRPSSRRGFLAGAATGAVTLAAGRPGAPASAQDIVSGTPDFSEAHQLSRYDPTVPPPSPGVYDLGDVQRLDAHFPSDGHRLAAHVYLPPAAARAAGRMPGIVIDAPGTSVKEITVPVYAIRLARAGYVVVSFDRRGFGASEGPVRQQMDPPQNIRDVRNATTYLLSREDVDPERIAILGICMGGGHTIQAAAFDRRYRAVATLAGHYTNLRMAREGRAHADWIALVRRRNDERLADLRAGRPLALRAFASEGSAPGSAHAIMPEAVNFYESRQRLVGPRWRNEMTYETQENMLSFDSVPFAGLIAPTPLLIIHGTIDPLSPGKYAQAVFDEAGDPRRIVWIETTNHSQLYDLEPYISRASEEIVRWFDRHVRS